MEFNKLVRDNIPATIRQSGQEPVIRILSDVEYDKNLGIKIEVELACAARLGATLEELEHLRVEKAEKHGGFGKRIFLIETRE